jgi:hypothetical protein
LKLHAEVARDPALKSMAQKALRSYVRSVHLQTNKRIFDVHKLPLAAFAESLGLQSIPRMRLLGNSGGEKGRKCLRLRKNQSKKLLAMLHKSQSRDHSGSVEPQPNVLSGRVKFNECTDAHPSTVSLKGRHQKPRTKAMLGRKADAGVQGYGVISTPRESLGYDARLSKKGANLDSVTVPQGSRIFEALLANNSSTVQCQNTLQRAKKLRSTFLEDVQLSLH